MAMRRCKDRDVATIQTKATLSKEVATAAISSLQLRHAVQGLPNLVNKQITADNVFHGYHTVYGMYYPDGSQPKAEGVGDPQLPTGLAGRNTPVPLNRPKIWPLRHTAQLI
jgi:hypothetical protein